MGDLGEPTVNYELGSLPPFLHQHVTRWKKDTAGDGWGPNPLDSLIGFAHAVQVRRRLTQIARAVALVV